MQIAAKIAFVSPNPAAFFVQDASGRAIQFRVQEGSHSLQLNSLVTIPLMNTQSVIDDDGQPYITISTERIRDVSIRLYQTAADYAATRGIIIADTKFEFGLDDNGTLHLMDEVLTADSSRFWPADSYAEGISPPSFDKQFVRDYLETLTHWNKTAPAPALPADVIEKTGAKYREALQRLTGNELRD